MNEINDIHRGDINSPTDVDKSTKSMESEALSPEEKNDLLMVKELFANGKQNRAQFDGDWKTRWDFYKGKQWSAQRASFKSRPVFNIIRSTIQSIIPILTDTRPGFNVVPVEPTDSEFADIMGTLVESWWDRADNSMQHTIVDVITDSQIFDYGVLKVVWDESAANGAGDVKVTTISPFDIYIPAEAIDFNKKCPWVIHRYNKAIGEIKQLFPNKASLIKADGSIRKDENLSQMAVKITSPTDQANIRADENNKNESQGMSEYKMVEVVELWIDDKSIEQYIEENEDKNGEIVQEKKFKRRFPNGKLIIAIPSQNILLASIPNPNQQSGNPFIRVIDTILPRSFNGEGETEHLIPLQRDINKTVSFIFDYQNFMSNPIWITEKGNGVNPNTLTNACGLIITVNEGKSSTVRRDIPGALSGDLFNFLNTLLSFSQTVTGIQEITQGRRPTGVTSGDALETLQEAAQTRIRLKERNLGTSLAQLGDQIIKLFMQHYKEPRVARITGKEGEWKNFFEFFIEDTPDGRKVVNSRKFVTDSRTGELVPETTFKTSKPSKGVFDLKVVTGSSLPFAKSQQANLAFRLFDKGALDQEGLLDAVDWKDREKLLERLRKQEELAQQQQQQEAAMAANGGGKAQ